VGKGGRLIENRAANRGRMERAKSAQLGSSHEDGE